MKIIHLRDNHLAYNTKEKTVLSVRDGVQEYLGVELGLKPLNKVFRVYRSPATISNLHYDMLNLPVTDGHVDVDVPVDNPVGSIKSSKFVNLFNSEVDSTLAIENKLNLLDFSEISENNKQLSLGYSCNVVEHDIYEFEQINIIPHHLALVSRARGGEDLTFKDSIIRFKPNKSIVFSDSKDREKYNATLNNLAYYVSELIDLVKNLPIPKIKEVFLFLEKYCKDIVNSGIITNSTKDYSYSKKNRDDYTAVLNDLDSYINVLNTVIENSELEVVEEIYYFLEELFASQNKGLYQNSNENNGEEVKMSDEKIKDKDFSFSKEEISILIKDSINEAINNKNEENEDDVKNISDNATDIEEISNKILNNISGKIDEVISTKFQDSVFENTVLKPKAYKILGSNYSFEDSEPNKIMRDSLTASGLFEEKVVKSFSDQQVKDCFKALKVKDNEIKTKFGSETRSYKEIKLEL